MARLQLQATHSRSIVSRTDCEAQTVRNRALSCSNTKRSAVCAVWLSSKQSTRHLGGSGTRKADMRTRDALTIFGSQNSPYPGRAPPSMDTEPKVFVNYTIYKSKSAMAVSLVKPRFRKQGGGGGGGNLSLEKAGGVMLELAPSTGVRQYDWGSKQLFMLSATEGMALASQTAGGQQLKFYHDPNKGRAGEGAIGKQLTVNPTPDGNGFYINLYVKSSMDASAPQTSIMVPVSQAEFEVLKSIIQYAVPHILGFSAIFSPELASGSHAGVEESFSQQQQSQNW